MKVIQRGSTWFLYGEGDSIFIEALCSHGPADYHFTIELNAGELNRYKESGNEYLNKLAYEIHYSAPGVTGSRSIYRERDVSRQYADKFKEAYLAWREEESGING